MARRAWFASGDVASHSPFAVERLESWQKAIEDGIIEPHEVTAQRERLLGLLRDLEPTLDDAQHERVTRVLEEWAVLQAMHGTLLVEEFGGGGASVDVTVAPDDPPDDAT